MNKTLLALLFLCVTSVSFAGHFHTKIIQVGAATDQYAVIKTAVSGPDKPDCALDSIIYSFDKTTEHGKALFSVALTAIASQKRVVVYYNQNCGLWGHRALVTRMDILHEEG